LRGRPEWDSARQSDAFKQAQALVAAVNALPALLDVAEAAEACAPEASRSIKAVYAPETRKLRLALDRLAAMSPNVPTGGRER